MVDFYAFMEFRLHMTENYNEREHIIPHRNTMYSNKSDYSSSRKASYPNLNLYYLLSLENNSIICAGGAKEMEL